MGVVFHRHLLAALGHGVNQAGSKVLGEGRVAHHHIGLARQQQAQRVQVGRTDGCPGLMGGRIDHRHLGVQKAGRVFMDLDAGREQGAIDRARGMELHEVLVPPLQQQAHRHAASRRVDQRLAKAPTRQEIGIGDDDLLRRPGDGAAVGALDPAPMQQVVA